MDIEYELEKEAARDSVLENAQAHQLSISVIIPVYNRGKLIRKTIESVRQQDFSGKMEIIVVDDGSTDDTKDVIKSISDSRIRYFYQTNSGGNKARNRGIDEARGEYVAFLDSDDLFLPNHLSLAFAALQQSWNAVVYSQIIVDRGNGRKFVKPPRALQENEHISEYLLCERGFFQTSSLVLSRRLAEKVRYAEGLPHGQDTDFAIRLSLENPYFIMLNQPTVLWSDIDDPNRVSSKCSPEARLAWLDRIRPNLTPKAYYGDCGWFVAKGYARKRLYLRAFYLYSVAVLRGCYTLRLASVIFLQIFLGNNFRKVADFYIRIYNSVGMTNRKGG